MVSVGEYILAINGVELRAPDNIYRLLDGTANRQTQITVNDKPSMDGSRSFTIVPTPNEGALRTRAWVESNRRLVDQLSGGQLAYVFVPNTGQPGYTSFNRYYFAQQDRQGAIVDERFNGGGSAGDCPSALFVSSMLTSIASPPLQQVTSRLVDGTDEPLGDDDRGRLLLDDRRAGDHVARLQCRKIEDGRIDEAVRQVPAGGSRARARRRRCAQAPATASAATSSAAACR